MNEKGLSREKWARILPVLQRKLLFHQKIERAKS